MDNLIKALCEAHSLSAISVMYQTEWRAFTAYLHWEGSLSCASGTGATFDEAFAKAISKMMEMRNSTNAEAAE